MRACVRQQHKPLTCSRSLECVQASDRVGVETMCVIFFLLLFFVIHWNVLVFFISFSGNITNRSIKSMRCMYVCVWNKTHLNVLNKFLRLIFDSPQNFSFPQTYFLCVSECMSSCTRNAFLPFMWIKWRTMCVHVFIVLCALVPSCWTRKKTWEQKKEVIVRCVSLSNLFVAQHPPLLCAVLILESHFRNL